VGDEDCLYLNVYTTKIELLKKRPVMVWIHGGGYLLGSGNADFYGPDYIVPKDVVLVTLNYRLGVLGTLAIISICISCMSFAFSNFFLVFSETVNIHLNL